MSHNFFTLSVLLAFTLIRTLLGEDVDTTVQSYSKGEEVVQATIDRIDGRCIFADDELFLKRAAFVQSHYGNDIKTFRSGYYGGIWQVDETMFLETSTCSDHLLDMCQRINTEFGIKWQTLQWHDLVKPLYSALAVKLYAELRHISVISGSITDQAWTWGMVFNKQTQYTEYVQKLANTTMVPCDKKMDIVFVVDATNTTSRQHFDHAKVFLKHIVDGFTIEPDKTRVGAIQSSNNAPYHFYLNSFRTKAGVQASIDNMRYGEMTLNAGQSITIAYEQMFSVDRGSRRDAVKVLLLITNGNSSNRTATMEAARKAREKGIIVLTMGVGLQNRDELKVMASHPECNHVFSSSTFNELESLHAEIVNRICRAPRSVVLEEGRAQQTFEIPANRTVMITEVLNHVDDGITIKTSVECGNVDIFIAFNTPHPNQFLYTNRDRATFQIPSVSYIKPSNDGSPLYVTYVGSHAPCNNGKRSSPKFTVTYTRGNTYGTQIKCIHDNITKPCTAADFLNSQYSNLFCQNNTSFCTTKECVLAASQVIQSMNYSADPCEDFYEYACGGWLDKHAIPDDSSGFDTFSKLVRDLQVELRGLLEKPIMEHEIEAVKKTKRLYRACINEDKIEEVGAAPLKKILTELGGWPVLEASWDSKNFNLVDLLIKLRLFNNDLLMSWGVTEDDKVPDKHILYFDQEGLGMPSREYYLVNRTDATIQAYEEIAVNAAIMLGADPTIARKDMKDVMDFEIQLAKITTPEEERQDDEKLYHKMTMEHLQNNVIRDLPFKWMDLVQGYFDHAKITINDTTEVIVYQISFIQKLSGLLKSTNNRILANYLISRFVRHRIRNLGVKFRHLSDKYDELLNGVKSTPARWKTCVSYVNSDTLMGDITGRMFVKRYFDEHSRDRAKLLIADLRASFRKIISDADWMDNSTRSYALEKLAAIDEKIGFDDQLLNDTFVDESNSMWDFKEDDYFGNVITAIRQFAIEDMQDLQRDVDKTQWTTTPGVINAFYSPSFNRITFPAGILQSPFYDKNFPSSMNYGGIGVIIGHEMTHGFDDMGREFDKDGKLRQWWTKSSLDKFKTRAKCLEDEYSAFVENGDHVKGDITLGENIADNGGMKIAYKAYQEHISKIGEEKPLPGVGLTHKQLVFVAFAQGFCAKSTKQYEHYLITTNEHSPEKFRIQGTLSNNRDFAREFKCKEGSTMNPTTKCAVW